MDIRMQLKIINYAMDKIYEGEDAYYDCYTRITRYEYTENSKTLILVRASEEDIQHGQIQINLFPFHAEMDYDDLGKILYEILDGYDEMEEELEKWAKKNDDYVNACSHPERMEPVDPMPSFIDQLYKHFKSEEELHDFNGCKITKKEILEILGEK